MSYKDDLRDGRWDEIRKKVLEWDSYRCIKCDNKSIENKFQGGNILEFEVDDSALLDPIYQGNKSDPRFFEPKITLNLTIQTTEGVKESIELKAYEEFVNYDFKTEYEDLKAYYTYDLSSDDLIEYYSRKKEQLPDCLVWGIKDETKNQWLYVRYMQIHHTYYQEGNAPWEYPLDSLKTLCRSCHKKLHKTEKIPVLDHKGRKITEYTVCKRCHGMGWFPQYKHVEGGICFRCDGRRYEELRT